MGAHLFLIANAAGFGEITVGLRLARELSARGDRVEFLAPRDASVLLKRTRFPHRELEPWYWELETRLPRLAREEGFDSIVLVDVTSVLLALQSLAVDTTFFTRLPVPVVALDFWDLRRAGKEWDLGGETWPLPPEAAALGRRMVPAPLAIPGRKAAFAALPRLRAPADVRPAERAALGLSDADRLIVFTSSRFQMPEMQVRKAGQRITRLLPEWVAPQLAALGDSVHVAHVGPAAFPAWSALGPRYRFLGQLDTERFHALLRAADLLLSFNTTGATGMAAVAAGLPVVAGMNSRGMRTLEEAAGVLGREPSPQLRAWLEQVVPLHPYHVWGLGLYHFLTPALRDNPYLEAIETVEVLDEGALAAACRRLLFDEQERARIRRRQLRYKRRVRKLPSAAEVFDQALASSST